MFIGAFLVSLVFAVIWLIVASLIPPLKRRPVGTHLIAMALAVAPQFLNLSGPTTYGLIAAIACCVLLYWQMKRAQAKLAATTT